MRTHFNFRFLSRMLIASAMLLLLSGCEINIGGPLTDDSVIVKVKLTLKNGYSQDAYLVLADLNESKNASTLVKPNASRVVNYTEQLSKDPKYEQTFSLILRGDGGKGSVEHTYYVDYRDFKLSSINQDDDKTTGFVNVNVNAVFTGTSWTVTATQGD